MTRRKDRTPDEDLGPATRRIREDGHAEIMIPLDRGVSAAGLEPTKEQLSAFARAVARKLVAQALEETLPEDHPLRVHRAQERQEEEQRRAADKRRRPKKP